MAEPTASLSINPYRELNEDYQQTEKTLRLGGGLKAIERQHAKGRLTARERLEGLVDDPKSFVEFGLWAGHGMYGKYGGAPGAGVVTGVGAVEGRLTMIIANDATVKAGAFFPMTCKKIIRAQRIAEMARLPLIYLVDSAGVFLPLQEDVFPDTDDFGRIFRNNAVFSAAGIPQIAAIMGYCVAGGGYLPVLCDSILMTEGSGLYLAGPALVKAAIGQVVTDEELGGAKMHATISGTIDYQEPDDESCLKRIRALMEANQATPIAPAPPYEPVAPARDPDEVYTIFQSEPGTQYDMRDLLHCFVDAESSESPDAIACFDEYKADYGQTVICAYARVGGHPCGIVANQKQLCKPGEGALQMGGVIYHDSANKAARFIMDCNQKRLPLLFVHDTSGFMVGKDSENHGIIRAGAKMVNALANSVVPKIALFVGGSYGAGNYAMCGRAFDPFLSLAWPMSKCAVMGANQATGTLALIEAKGRERRGEQIDEDERQAILKAVHDSYTEQADIRHAAARGWVDRIIQPHETRKELIAALSMTHQFPKDTPFRTGVLQT
jgi:3-methylcrotonyl-CoA carboxylase beta subunit